MRSDFAASSGNCNNAASAARPALYPHVRSGLISCESGKARGDILVTGDERLTIE